MRIQLSYLHTVRTHTPARTNSSLRYHVHAGLCVDVEKAISATDLPSPWAMFATLVGLVHLEQKATEARCLADLVRERKLSARRGG